MGENKPNPAFVVKTEISTFGVNYCNQQCQKLHWATHKKFCKELAVKYQKYLEEKQKEEILKKEQEENERKLQETNIKNKEESESKDETTTSREGSHDGDDKFFDASQDPVIAPS